MHVPFGLLMTYLLLILGAWLMYGGYKEINRIFKTLTRKNRRYLVPGHIWAKYKSYSQGLQRRKK